MLLKARMFGSWALNAELTLRHIMKIFIRQSAMCLFVYLACRMRYPALRSI